MAGMPALFEPLRLGGIALANRIAVSPMCQYSAANGAANDRHLQHLGSLSLSGAGLVIVEQTAVKPAGRIVTAAPVSIPMPARRPWLAW
jgi:2,4-dienoyl-CoA reductase-like NADH-dependent reductase (Old Yellow Enzyme family)